MPSHDRRAAARRRAWGRGPMILQFEPLEGRQLMAATPRGGNLKPDLVATRFDTLHNLDWGDAFHAVGEVGNQGNGTALTGFKVDVYASSGPTINARSVLIGSIDVPAGLTPGTRYQFDKVLNMPGSPLPFTDINQAVFISTRVNPDNSPAESNRRNNERQGQGFDTSVVTITPPSPANLVGTAIGVTPNSLSWGDTFSLTTQIANTAEGNAPSTRARLVLTPAGITPGGPSDVTIDSFSVPAVAAFQSVNVIRDVKLPKTPPSVLAGGTQFVLTVVPDADFQTNAALSAKVAQGLNLDQTTLSIAPLANPEPVPPRAELAAVGLTVPTTPVAWGQSIPISTTLQNLGQADTGPLRVRFLLTGANGSVSDALFLADASIPGGLKAGFSQEVKQTARIPSRLPNGLLLNGDGIGRILVAIDPENTLDEPLKTNNLASSAPIRLKLLGTNGGPVPNLPSGNPLGNPAPAGTKPFRQPQSNQEDSGLKGFGDKVGNFFKDIGDKLSITGGSRR